MGQTPSQQTSSWQGRLERRRSFKLLPSFSGLTKTPNHSSLSATFTVFDYNLNNDLVNINTASEEQLMTLPMVTREIAHNIIEYRKVIGKFRRVDDLALVSGVGAEKLYKIRNEICVRNGGGGDFNQCSGFSSNSVNSLSSDRTTPQSELSNYLDLNKASVFELQTLVGMSQELAANIIYYRERKGPFKTIEDLRKVKGIDSILFSALRSYVIVDDNEDNNLVITNNNNSTSKSQITLNSDNRCNKQTISTNLNNSIPVNDIFELLSTYSYRPIVDEFFYLRNGRRALRVATWNLHQLTEEKAKNLGFLEVCCRTILENRLSIIGVQEIETEVALSTICDELNNPKLRRVIEWEQKYNKITKNIFKYFYWQCNRLGFIYLAKNECLQIEFLSYQQLNTVDNDNNNRKMKKHHRKKSNRHESDEIDYDDNTINVIIARMCINNLLYLNIVNMKIVAIRNNSTQANPLLNTIENLLDSNNIIVVGDFTGFQPIVYNNGISYKNIFNNIPTNSAGCTIRKTSTSKIMDNEELYYDNILLSNGISDLYTGHCGIVRQGLTHLAIPNGWSWGGVASPHCPVWVELYTNLSEDNS